MSAVPQSNLYGVPVGYNHADAAHGQPLAQAPLAAETSQEQKRGRLVSGVALILHGGAATAALVGALTPTATTTFVGQYAVVTVDSYLYQQVVSVPGGATTTVAYTSDYCLYPLASAALACACVAAAANGLLGLFLLWRVIQSTRAAAPSNTPSLLVWLAGLGAMGASAAALACAAMFYDKSCVGQSLHSAGFSLSVGFGFLAIACAASVVALLFTAASLRYLLAAQPQSVSLNTPLAKNAV